VLRENKSDKGEEKKMGAYQSVGIKGWKSLPKKEKQKNLHSD